MSNIRQMNIREDWNREIEAFPLSLRSLLEAELSAGNEIEEVGHGFPAPPVGAYIKLKKCVTTRDQNAKDGLNFREGNSSTCSGEFTDKRGYFFILNPPLPEQPQPTMDEIREAHSHGMPALQLHGAVDPPAGTPLDRFHRSMQIDYEKWHDGIGYDLDALQAANPTERKKIEQLLAPRFNSDWRDVEALAALNTPAARKLLLKAMKQGNSEIRAAVLRYSPDLISQEERIQPLVQALRTAEFYSGLSETLDLITDFHPAQIIDALVDWTLKRSGEIAVHFAAMLVFIHGKASEPFDVDQRPFFLRFNTPVRADREAAFRDLCEKIGVDPTNYL